MPIPTDSERIGTTIDKKYRIESLIGRGGMGTVFRATHTWTNRAVALKILQPQYAENDAVVLRFLREARAAASFRHPNVVEVLDMGALPEGGAYMALAFLDGESLASVLERSTRLSVEEAFVVLVPVMRALSLAHSRGIVHRDIKPDNLFLARNDEGATIPTLLDFGIAKLEDSHGKVTTTGVIFGTPQYMSPEQARGVSDIDGRADVWSMAAVWFECLTGQPPFDAPVPTALIAKLLSERAPYVNEKNPAIPAAIAAAVDRGLEPNRDARYSSMDAFVDALLEAAQRDDIRTTQVVVPVRTSVSVDSTGSQITMESARTVVASEAGDPKTTMDAVVAPRPAVQRSALIAGAIAFVAVLGIAGAARLVTSSAAPRPSAIEDASMSASLVADATARVVEAEDASVQANVVSEDAAALAVSDDASAPNGRSRPRENGPANVARATQDAGARSAVVTVRVTPPELAVTRPTQPAGGATQGNTNGATAGNPANSGTNHTIGVSSNY